MMMEAQAPAAMAMVEEPLDVRVVRGWDLRLLGQDEIQALARLCGDVPARLQDLVNVIIDRSVFNESPSGRRQTFDRDRVSSAKDRRHSSDSSTPTAAAAAASALAPQVQLVLDGAPPSSSHRELIIHLCRHLRICEKGDSALSAPSPPALPATQHHAGPQNSTPVAHPSGNGTRPLRLKSMARASSYSDPPVLTIAAVPSVVVPNDKSAFVDNSQRMSKKMSLKEEARRKAATILPESQGEAARVSPQDNNHVSFKTEVLSTPKERSTRVASAHLKSPQTDNLLPTSSNAMVVWSQPRKIPSMENRTCNECGRRLANAFSLRRHGVLTGHNVDAVPVDGTPKFRFKTKSPSGQYICNTCGHTFATSATLRRHAVSSGHIIDKAQESHVKIEKEHSENVYDTDVYVPETQHLEEQLDSTNEQNVLNEQNFVDEHNINDKQKAPETKNAPEKEDVSEKQDIPEKQSPTSNADSDETDLPKQTWKNKQFKCTQCPSVFNRKKQYVHHLTMHFRNQKKKLGRPSKLVARPIGRPPGKIKGKLGRPSKHAKVEMKVEEIDKPKKFENLEKLENLKRKREEEALDKQVKLRPNEANSCDNESVPRFPEKPTSTSLTCQECGKVFDEYSRYTGHLSMHSRGRRLFSSDSIAKEIASKGYADKFNLNELSALGFKRLLSGTSGTYLSSLPAKLLFSGQ